MTESRDGKIPKGALDLTLAAIPQRSRLYSLEPAGLRTSHVESLTSYIIRLAEEHCVTVGSLYNYELYPLVKKPRSGGKYAKYDKTGVGLMYEMKITNGAGSWAKTWVRAVENSTLRSDLSLLTTLPWGSDLGWFCKLRESPAWCSDCYDEWREAGKVIYTPLAWMLRAVNVCTTHRRFLEEVCPRCHRRPQIFAYRSLAGCCSRCGYWLGSNRETDGAAAASLNPQDLSRETWVSTNVSEWIAFAQGLSVPPAREVLAETIAELIRQVTGGNGDRFARTIGVSPVTLREVRRNRSAPQLDLLLKICSNFGFTLTELLTGPAVLDRAPSASNDQTRLGQRASLAPPYKKAELITFLKAALQEYPPPSLHDLAARLGYKSATSLRQASPELSRNMTARYRAASTSKGGGGDFKRDSQTVRSVLEAALERECPPSVSELSLTLEYKCSTSLRRRFPDLCRRLVVKRADFRCKFIRGWRKVLEGVLEEIPPPSLREVMRRLGTNYANMVYRWFPDVCPSIVARHNAWKKICFKQVRLKLQAALEEAPPRPMKELALELNFDVATLRRRYKELCRQISARFTAYALRAAEERRRLVRKEVREAAGKLIERGLHPTDERVRPLLKKWRNRYSAERNATLRSMRREFGLPDRGPDKF